MKFDRSGEPLKEKTSEPEFREVARVVDGLEQVRIKGPILGRVVRIVEGEYVIESAGGRLTLATNLRLKLHQRVELRPWPPDQSSEHPPQLEVIPIPAGVVAIFGIPRVRLSRATPASSARPTGPADSQGPPPESGKSTSVRLPILGVESPDLRTGEDTILGVIEAEGNRALVELKGIQVIVESAYPLTPGQELLCRAINTRPLLVLQTLRMLSLPATESEQSSSDLYQPHLPFRIEVREHLLPEFPTETEVVATVFRIGPQRAVLSLGPVRIRVGNVHGLRWHPGDRLYARVLPTRPQPTIEVRPAGT